MIGITHIFKIILSNYWSFCNKFCIFEINKLKKNVLGIFYDSRKHMSNMLLKNEKYHFFQLQNLDGLTLTMFNKIVFPFISGHKLIYYTK